MKKKIILVIGLLFIIIIMTIYMFQNNSKAIDDNTSTISQAEATRQTILNTLSSSGQVNSALTEKVALHATYYFDEIYVEENSAVKEGENILLYTNGTYLKAPYDCVINSINIPNEDEMCTNEHYIEIKTTETLQMSLSLDETELDSIEIGQEAEITLNVNSEKTYKGWVTSVDEVATYSSNGSTFNVYVTFANDESIKLGMSATCNIILDKADNVITVPIEAVQTQNGQKYVIVINEDGTMENKTIETGISNDAYIEIKSGVEEGENVQIIKQDNASSTFMKGNMQMPSGGQIMNGQKGAGMMQSGSKPQMQQ